jgi:hypothetical protein
MRPGLDYGKGCSRSLSQRNDASRFSVVPAFVQLCQLWEEHSSDKETGHHQLTGHDGPVLSRFRLSFINFQVEGEAPAREELPYDERDEQVCEQ